jgi:hypothetical protein
MDPRERPVREHARPDEHDLRGDEFPGAPRRSLHKPRFTSQSPSAWVLPLAVPILSLILLALILSGCEIGVALGLPNNADCRDTDTLPGSPISGACLDSIGTTSASP